MRILQVCPYSWDSPGGVQIQVEWLARHLARRGHDVLVAAPGREHPREPFVRLVGAPLRVPYNGSIAPICPSPRARAQLGRILTEFRPDVVHVHEPFVPSLSLFATLRSRVPVVATFHANGDPAALFTLAAPLIRLFVWRKIDVPTAVSDAAAAFVGRRMGATPQVLPNGLDFEMFRDVRRAPLPQGRTLLFASRLEPRKGFPVMVRAFATLADRFPDLQLVVIGDGRDRDAIEMLSLRHRRRVTMLGTLPRHDDLAPYLAAADVFGGPATGGESFGIVLLEAMAAGLPVVATDIPGYREVVRHDVEGLLVAPHDPQSLALAMERVLTEPALAARLAAAGRVRARQFAWDSLVERFEAIYAAPHQHSDVAVKAAAPSSAHPAP